MRDLAGLGFDGVMAKRLDAEYVSGERTGMVKIKNLRTADCVVGDFAMHRKAVASGQCYWACTTTTAS